MRAAANTILGQLVVTAVVALYIALLIFSRLLIWGWVHDRFFMWVVSALTPFVLGIGIPYWIYAMHQLGQFLRDPNAS